jgi:hypothetical protein
MTSCGICVSAEAIRECSQCRVQTCGKCNKCESFQGNIYAVCVLCHSLLEGMDLFDGEYCMHCDNYIPDDDYYDPCLKCFDKKITIENRLLLPHYKARPIIETYHIPDIAQLIFDYYYVPRRYYEGEF